QTPGRPEWVREPAEDDPAQPGRGERDADQEGLVVRRGLTPSKVLADRRRQVREEDEIIEVEEPAEQADDISAPSLGGGHRHAGAILASFARRAAAPGMLQRRRGPRP